MSSTRYVEPLDLEIRPSRLIAALIFAIHITAAVVCVQLPLTPFSRLILLLAVLGSLMWNMTIFWRRTPRSLYWSPEGGWRIIDRSGSSLEVRLMPETHLGSWFVIAHFSSVNGKHCAVMLARDSCHAEGMRRLRIMLKYGTPDS